MYTTMTGSELKWHSGALMIFSAIYLLLVGFLGPVLKITQNVFIKSNIHLKTKMKKPLLQIFLHVLSLEEESTIRFFA